MEALLATQAMLSTEFKQRIERVETQIGEMSRSVAKKLSLMIDLVMSLSDQVANQAAASHQAAAAAAAAVPPGASLSTTPTPRLPGLPPRPAPGLPPGK